jgi:hypothetical protein
MQPASVSDLATGLQRRVKVPAGDIGERNAFRPAALHATADYIERQWAIRRVPDDLQDAGDQRKEGDLPGRTLETMMVVTSPAPTRSMPCPLSRFSSGSRSCVFLRLLAHIRHGPCA